MLTSLFSLIRMGFLDPSLMLVAWKIKRDQKTYLSYYHLFNLAKNYFLVRSRTITGVNIAEFGVGRGGSALLLAWLVNKYGGTLTLFDTFQGIPAPTAEDGELAQQRYKTIKTKEGDKYYGNIDNLVDVILRELGQVCELKKIEIVVGNYKDTLPLFEKNIAFNLIHIDCDWYQSVKIVLDFLEMHHQQDSIIQIDDYSGWQGAKKAVDKCNWLKTYHRYLINGPLVVDTSKKL